ncbi:MAG: hypothetical protein IPN69_11790 [Acidobacteria bacterium]|nr:hypothetical protein [Acidobacteriota bacterium]
MIKKSMISTRNHGVGRLNDRYSVIGRRVPFWLPASRFYILSIGITLASFFLFWGILHDGEEAMPWIPAAIAAGFILFGAVILREIILRKYRVRYLIAEKRLDQNLDRAKISTAGPKPQSRLSIEQNAELVKRIKKKSAAAKTLMRLPAGHMEVFEFCTEYLRLTDRELQTVATGSPRLAAFWRGRDVAEEIRKDHLLIWAEIEAKRLTKEAQSRVTIAERIETAQRAVDVLVTALEYYPKEETLVSSRVAVEGVISSMRVSHWIELAERAQFKGNTRRAISHYKDALFFMARDGSEVPDAEALAERINGEIERITNAPKATRSERPTNDND